MSLLFPLIRPFLFRLDPETAHNLTIAALKSGLVPMGSETVEKPVEIGSLRFRNACGLAAGFDKNAVAVDSLIKMGFGFVEVGGVTPKPQPGNPRPRVFRLTEDQGVINRYGLNSDGAEAVARNLEKRQNRDVPVGINLGANKESTDRTRDYAECLKVLGGLADFATVNVSSPNTPGLRMLQDPAELTAIFDRLNAVKSENGLNIPLWLKIAPDLAEEDREAVARCLPDLGIEALVVANTTIDRPASLQSRHRGETGGLSGAPLTEKINGHGRRHARDRPADHAYCDAERQGKKAVDIANERNARHQTVKKAHGSLTKLPCGIAMPATCAKKK